MRRIAALAEAHYIWVASHNPMGPLATAMNVHFCAGTANFKILKYKPPVECDWATDPYIPVDGHMYLRPYQPGWGLQTDDYVHWERKATRWPEGFTAWP